MGSFRNERFIDTEETLVRFVDPRVAFKNCFKASTINGRNIINLLITERRNSSLFDYVWRKAEAHFNTKKSLLRNNCTTDLPDECHIAVIAYALDTSYNGVKLYQDFNARSRRLTSDASWDAFPYKSMYCLLLKSIQGIKNNPSITSQAFRGVNFHYNNLQVGQKVCFNQFTSSSTHPGVASFFKGGKGTIIEFPYGAKTAIGIENLSPYSEGEILIFPWSTFTIVRWDRSGSTHRIILDSGERHEYADDDCCTIL